MKRKRKILKRLIQKRAYLVRRSGAQAIVIEKLRELGLDLDIWEPSFSKMKDHPYFCITVQVFQIADHCGNP